jgi:hypothetical protein
MKFVAKYVKMDCVYRINTNMMFKIIIKGCVAWFKCACVGSRRKDAVRHYYQELCYIIRTTCLGSKDKDDVKDYYKELCYMTRTTCLGSRDKDDVRDYNQDMCYMIRTTC